jgi:hypothetical protein
MQLQKISSILVFSVLLIIVAVGLLGTTVYFLLEKNNHTAPRADKPKALAVQTTPVRQDPAQYTTAKEVQTAIVPLSKDSIDLKLQEIYAMKNALPSGPGDRANGNDTEAAQQKITELLRKVEELKNRTTAVESENRFLKALLGQITDELHSRQRNNTQHTPTRSASASTGGATFTATDLRFSFLNEGEKETGSVREARSISGGFSFRTSGQGNEVFYIVVVRPDGKVLQASSWDGGVFETSDGRKMYSYKVLSEGTETIRHVHFSIQAENMTAGKYRLEVYHNGTMIGSLTKTLS